MQAVLTCCDQATRIRPDYQIVWDPDKFTISLTRPADGKIEVQGKTHLHVGGISPTAFESIAHLIAAAALLNLEKIPPSEDSELTAYIFKAPPYTTRTYGQPQAEDTESQLRHTWAL